MYSLQQLGWILIDMQNKGRGKISCDLREHPRNGTCVIIPSDVAEVNKLERLILDPLKAGGYAEKDVFAIRLALEEAVTNAMKHGNLGDRAKQVTISSSIEDDEVTLTVTDEGNGFDPDSVPDPTKDENLEMTHGRGILLMRSYMDSITYNRNGNSVKMVKVCHKDGSASLCE